MTTTKYQAAPTDESEAVIAEEEQQRNAVSTNKTAAATEPAVAEETKDIELTIIDSSSQPIGDEGKEKEAANLGGDGDDPNSGNDNNKGEGERDDKEKKESAPSSHATSESSAVVMGIVVAEAIPTGVVLAVTPVVPPAANTTETATLGMTSMNITQSPSQSELPNPTLTNHFWFPSRYKLNNYERISALVSSTVCCCGGCCYCCCRNCIEPGTLDHCCCYFPSTCFHCYFDNVNCCCLCMEMICLCPCNAITGPLRVVYHNIMRCLGVRHRYHRVMRHYNDGKDHSSDDPLNDITDAVYYSNLGSNNNHSQGQSGVQGQQMNRETSGKKSSHGDDCCGDCGDCNCKCKGCDCEDCDCECDGDCD